MLLVMELESATPQLKINSLRIIYWSFIIDVDDRFIIPVVSKSIKQMDLFVRFSQAGRSYYFLLNELKSKLLH